MQIKHKIKERQRGFVLIELIVVVAIIAILIALLLPSVQQAREAARATHCKNNLMQIGVALQNYHMAHRVLPSGSVNPQGPIYNQPKGYHVSWVLQILPLLDEKAAYLSFDFKYGAYALTNLNTANYFLSCFVCPSNPRNGTSYVGCHNDTEAPIDVDNNGVLYLNSSIREKDLKDGRSYTIFVGESIDGGFLSWTSGTSSTLRNMGPKINYVDPNQAVINQVQQYGYQSQFGFNEDEDPDSFNPVLKGSDAINEVSLTPEQRKLLLYVGGFSSAHLEGAHFCLGDGSVRFISQKTDYDILQNLANRHDSNLIGEY
ncbi:MAG: DUF1559 domain-containing protein [Gimesia sp.]